MDNLTLNEEDFVEKGGLCCPVCRSTEIETTGPATVSDLYVFHAVRCNSCKAEWSDRYELAGYDWY